MTTYYHGLTRGPLPPTGFAGPEVYLALAPDLADAYADDSGVVLACEYTGAAPLVLDTCTAFLTAWQASGADTVVGPFHPVKTHAFADWARRQGHAAVLVPESAFDDEDGYYEVGGRLGDPQLIVLDPACVRVVGPC